MTQQNERAEELMRRIEKREEEMAREQPSKHFYHLCIVNLVIGTLYCSKGNFEFGLSRVMKSLEPYQAKLGPDTWFYAKRCFVAVLDALAKHMLVFKDKFFIDVLAFLDGAERHGKGISTVISAPGGAAPDPHTHNVASEARLLKHLFLRHLQ
jgi:tetratricopeptide repeat protein 30